MIPVVGLSSLLFLATSIFQQDKIPAVFEASLSLSQSRASRVNVELASLVSLAQAVVLSYRADTRNLAESGEYYFRNEEKFEAFRVHSWNSVESRLESAFDVSKPSAQEALKVEPNFFKSLSEESDLSGVAVRPSLNSKWVWVAARFGDRGDPARIVAVALFNAENLAAEFEMNEGSRSFRSFIVRKNGSESLFTAASDWEKGWGPGEVWGEIAKWKRPEGTGEITSPSQRVDLVSFADVGTADLAVVTMNERAEALRALDTLRVKSGLFFIAVLSATAMIAVLAARGLTSALSRLSEATKKVAEGDFGVRVDSRAGGEIGLLAHSFNSMAEEVSRLMKETAEKARMESELATAKTVQETLFPESHAELGVIEITGHYVPASECGGDWWYYAENDGKVYIWIGDATGHGAPAALLTSAARAVASVIHFGPARPVSEALGILNRAICETSKGRMMMTFFLACIDKETGVMTYSNASHEPPLLLKKREDSSEPSRDDFIPLNEVNNPRLGEQASRLFNETSIQLSAGDRIVFYTDGVVDVKNPEMKNWGERRFLKTLSAQLAESTETRQALGGVVSSIEDFRSDTPLDDDVTLILCSYRGAA